MMLVIDDRENELVINKIQYRMGDDCVVKRLNSADYVIGDLGIEAKEINDLYRSIMGIGRSRTIVGQLVDLQRNYKNPMLIVYGSILKPFVPGGRPTQQNLAIEKTRMVKTIQNFKATFYTRFPNIRYMEVSNMEEFVNWLITNHTQYHVLGQAKETTTKILRDKDGDSRVTVLSSVAGVTRTEAEKLLEEFGSLPKILNSRQTQKALMEIEGIGREKAKRILSLREPIGKE